MGLEDDHTFGFEIIGEVLLIIGIIILNVQPPQRSIERTFNIHIIANILINIMLISQHLVWAGGSQKRLLRCLLVAHFFVVVISCNLLDLVPKLGHLVEKLLELVKCCICALDILHGAIDIVDMRLLRIKEGCGVHRIHLVQLAVGENIWCDGSQQCGH